MAKSVKNPNNKPVVIAGGKLNNLLNNITEKILRFRKSKNFYVLIIIVALLLLAIYKKEWIIAATVNGAPIANPELQIRMNRQFRTQTLNQLINEKIILNEAAKNNVFVSEEEITKKITEIEASLGGTQTLDAMLAQQGQTRTSLRDQIKLQVSIEKLYAKDATVSAEEINKFVEENKEQLRATDSAAQAKEAEEILRNQKLTQVFSQKFQELRQKAKIQIF